MKKLLATSAIAIVALSGAASAQSVLERVLGQIDNATNLASVNGTFANIAENIGNGSAVTVYIDGEENVISQDEYEAGLQDAIDTAVAALPAAELAIIAGGMPDAADYGDLTIAENQTAYNNAVTAYNAAVSAQQTAISGATTTYEGLYTADLIEVSGLQGIDGSINNTLDGINGATQEAIASIDVSAIEWNMPTFDFGDMATTALGAVNTGDITLGVNSAVDEASTSTTNAISAVINQLGGSADTGAIVLNVASNMTGVNGSINNVMEQVNGSIGNLSTTALGAVNTGTIVSGVDAAVAGIVGSTSGGSNGQ
ncbi:hypothetical protein [Nioella ostreopsis]|uniref:hypothetical protein n=1 Tax=Nioella ostreopsis TaxID=2448479 RepID=UPI000FD863B9|nr:hypothetical protein [Nioella ostreopsis]